MPSENLDGNDNPAFVQDEDKWSKDKDGPALNSSAETPHMEYGPNENRRMLKNLVVICFAFMLLFTAFQSMAALQNSLNPADGVGTYSLSVLYASLVVSSMFLPTFLIQKFTVKWTLAFAVLGYSVYIAAQFKPEFYTLIPAAIIVGICGAPLWSAKCTYLTHLGHQYAALVKEDAQVIIVRFFGLFFLFFQSSSVWGNLISSAVLENDKRNCTNDPEKMCGVNFCHNTEFCDKDKNSTESDEDKTTIYILSSIYLSCTLAAVVVVVLFLDPLIRYGEKERQGAANQLTGKSLLIATFKHMKNPYQLLLIPLTIWSGMEQGFFGAEFTTGWIDCAWGIEKIGYVLVCYGVVDAIASISFGPVIKYVGRLPVFIFGALVNIAMIIVFFTWTPNKDESIYFFVIAGFWGIGDAIWQTQINAFYGVIFPQDEEAAFSNYRLWESVGFILAYVFSNLLCVRVKLWILLAVISLGMCGYFIIEVKEKQKKAQTKSSKN